MWPRPQKRSSTRRPPTSSSAPASHRPVGRVEHHPGQLLGDLGVGGHELPAALLAGAAQLLGAALVAPDGGRRRVALPKQWSKCQWVLTPGGTAAGSAGPGRPAARWPRRPSCGCRPPAPRRRRRPPRRSGRSSGSGTGTPGRRPPASRTRDRSHVPGDQPAVLDHGGDPVAEGWPARTGRRRPPPRRPACPVPGCRARRPPPAARPPRRWRRPAPGPVPCRPWPSAPARPGCGRAG